MSYLKSGFLSLLAVAFLILPTACEDDRPERIQDIEVRTSPDQLSDWLEQLPKIIRSTGMTGAEASRMLAYASIAYYEGYSLGFDDMRSLVGQAQGLDELPVPDSSLSYSFGIIAESAMRTVLINQFQNATNSIKLIINSTYAVHEREYIVAGVGDVVINRSRAFGELLGDALNVWADQDGYLDVLNCQSTIPTGPEYWQPTPPSFQNAELPCWGNLRAFTFSSEQLIALCNPGAPVAVSTESGSAYEDDINEVIEITAQLNPAQMDVIKFWKDDEGTLTVPGHFASILTQFADQNSLDGKQTITAFAQLSIAMADTYISSYRLKYTHYRPRPISIIQESSNTNWESYLKNPSTPEFPSVRATVAYSSAQVFINLFGNNVSFRDNSQSIFNLDERVYSSFNEMAAEAVYSRLYAGTNIRSTLEKSELHGRCIAQRANELFFNQ